MLSCILLSVMSEKNDRCFTSSRSMTLFHLADALSLATYSTLITGTVTLEQPGVTGIVHLKMKILLSFSDPLTLCCHPAVSFFSLVFCRDEVERRFEGKLNKNMSGSLYEMVSRVMKALVNRKITVPGNFQG